MLLSLSYSQTHCEKLGARKKHLACGMGDLPGADRTGCVTGCLDSLVFLGTVEGLFPMEAKGCVWLMSD